jgi:hypothetical protein
MSSSNPNLSPHHEHYLLTDSILLNGVHGFPCAVFLLRFGTPFRIKYLIQPPLKPDNVLAHQFRHTKTRGVSELHPRKPEEFLPLFYWTI